MKVSIICPVWNRSDLTHRFLGQHWMIYMGYPGVEWVIVDNASTDNTAAVLNTWQRIMGPRLKVLTMEKNIGFGPANNRGADVAEGDILAFVSNDVNADGDYLTPLSEAIQGEPNALYGAQIFSHNTGWNTFKEVGRIAYIAGWCVVSERQFWAKIGPWDERFVPCDYEDLDLSYRVQKANFPIVPLKLPLRHDSGKSAENLAGGRLKVTLENKQRFIEKWGLTPVNV